MVCLYKLLSATCSISKMRWANHHKSKIRTIPDSWSKWSLVPGRLISACLYTCLIVSHHGCMSIRRRSAVGLCLLNEGIAGCAWRPHGANRRTAPEPMRAKLHQGCSDLTMSLQRSRREDADHLTTTGTKLPQSTSPQLNVARDFDINWILLSIV